MKKSILSVALVAAFAHAASAVTIMHSVNYGPSTVPFNTVVNLPKFDTTLGTLNSVTIKLSAGGTAEVQVFNATGGALPYSNATAAVPITATGPGGTSTGTTLTAGPLAGNANPGANSNPGVAGTAPDSSVNVAPANFGLYSGVGVANFPVDIASSGGTFSGTGQSGALFFGGNASVEGTVMVTYDYTVAAVADGASTVCLLGASLASLLVLGRRR